MPIVDIMHRGRRIEIHQIGPAKRYTIHVNGEVTQKDLSAEATIRWMANAMHEEPNDVEEVKSS